MALLDVISPLIWALMNEILKYIDSGAVLLVKWIYHDEMFHVNINILYIA